MDTLLRLSKRWLQPDLYTATKVVERVAVDWILRTLLPTECQAVGMQGPGTSRELLTTLECTLNTLALGEDGQHPQSGLDYRTPEDEPRPTEPDQGMPKKVQKTWQAGCVLPTLDLEARGKEDVGTEGKLHTPSNPLSSVFQQVNRQGNFRWEQKEDDCLKHCWAQVRQIEGVDQSPNQRLPSSYVLVRGGLLYQQASCQGEIVDLLVVPKTKTLMHLAHAHPLGGHLGARNTLEKLKDCFVWSGMDAEVWGFCQQCPQCQHTAPRRPPPAPLIPLSLTGIPFERVSVDLMGLLPKSARGHEYILDYAT
ncbi:uncharacterized protein LOC108255542 [Ictalurus punctatus]|uniref:Gypsy retrotransposon integrase-like protein 1 n=1 Tax=Ictalurus punctatus TaxID=7998 RepID=A0A2D0PM16_ICTPU|nr:uncharacterized protein LOC108255542 [Ictalurus punctatus]XP_017307044.1 uncharacterized protein LOC108255542 [Ictalurus punctatus]